MANTKKVFGSIEKRVGKFRTMAEDTMEDIKKLEDIKKSNESAIIAIEAKAKRDVEIKNNENTAIDAKADEARGFVEALNSFFKPVKK